MSQLNGLTHDGLKTALGIKKKYQAREPICLPGEKSRILLPENLMNHHVDLQSMEDPLALSMMATRDPEAPMALAAAARLIPLGKNSELINGVFRVVGETSKHPLIAKCVSMITENAFSPDAITLVRDHATKYIVNTRKEYTLALRQNLQALLDGSIAPRHFVNQFFELTEAGNMRSDIRKKLVLSLLVSENIRPSIKFLFLENFDRMPKPVQSAIVRDVEKAPPSHHMEMIKEEVRWIVARENEARGVKRAEQALIKKPVKSAGQMAAVKVQSVSRQAAKATPRPWRPGELGLPSGSKGISWN